MPCQLSRPTGPAAKRRWPAQEPRPKAVHVKSSSGGKSMGTHEHAKRAEEAVEQRGGHHETQEEHASDESP
jgi:hypothetical protein